MKPFNTPALLSLFAPGFGQLVKGHTGKAILIMAIAFLLLLNYRFGWVLRGNENLLLVTFSIQFVVTAWSVHDAYNSDDDWSNTPKK